MMRGLLQDLSQAARALRRAPAFSLTAAATLAIGIGANTTIFSAVRAVLLRPLPYPQPERLVQLMTVGERGLGTAHSPPNFADLRKSNRSFSEMAAFNAVSRALTGVGVAEQVPSADVTGGFFAVLGVGAALGRPLGPADDAVEAPRTAVLAHGLWRRRFGADSGVVGRVITLDGEPWEVVGVMPPGFSYPLGAELWMPMRFTAADLTTQRGAYYLDVIARLSPGVSLERARADVSAIADRLAAGYPNTNRGVGVTAESLHQALVGEVRRPLVVLLGAVGLVLLIACVNVANLLLVRGVGRARELAVRAALGAGAPRLVRAQLAESVVLAALGGGAGLLLALWGGGAVQRLAGPDVPFLDQTRLDAVVLGFAAAVSLLTAFLFGGLPAWHAARATDLAARLREDSLAAVGDRGHHRLRHVLAVAQLALATALLVGAGLLGRTLGELVRVDLGLQPRGALTFAISLPAVRYDTPERRAQFVEQALNRLGAIPGVEAAGAAFGMPLTGWRYTISAYELDGQILPEEDQDRLSVQVRVVTPEFFRAVGIAVQQGRVIGPADRHGSPPVVVLNRSAARLLFPGKEPLGRRFTIGTRLGQGRERVGGEVVGVISDVKEYGPALPARPTIYVAHAQWPVDYLGVALRTGGEPARLAEAARRAVAELDPDLPVFRVRTLEQLAADAVAQPRLYATLFALFAAVAVALAALGVYGVLAHGVASRTREIGVRVALGAGRGEVVGMVMRQGALLAGAGVALGLAGARASAGVMARLLFGVGPADAVTFATVPAGLLAVALLACYLPARRAAAVDPMVALRAE